MKAIVKLSTDDIFTFNNVNNINITELDVIITFDTTTDKSRAISEMSIYIIAEIMYFLTVLILSNCAMLVWFIMKRINILFFIILKPHTMTKTIMAIVKPSSDR